MKMNKKVLLIVLIIITLIAVVISTIMEKKDNQVKEIANEEIVEEVEEESDYYEERNLLAQKTYAYEYQAKRVQSGMFILTDGSIYSYYDDSSNGNNGNTLDSMIENSTKMSNKVSERDLELIEDYIENLENEIDSTYIEGNNRLTMIKVYTEKGPILLKTTGMQEGENKTFEGQELLRILNKYIE